MQFISCRLILHSICDKANSLHSRSEFCYLAACKTLFVSESMYVDIRRFFFTATTNALGSWRE